MHVHPLPAPPRLPKEYYKRNVTLPLVDHLLMELTSRFSEEAKRATEGLKLIPPDSTDTNGLFDFYENDLPSPETVDTEVHIWRMKWDKVPGPDLPDTLSKALDITVMIHS